MVGEEWKGQLTYESTWREATDQCQAVKVMQDNLFLISLGMAFIDSLCMWEEEGLAKV